MSTVNWLAKIGYRRIIFVILILTIVSPLLLPLGFPLVIRQDSRDFANYSEAIPKGGVVCIVDDMMVGGYPEIGPGMVAMMKYYFTKGVGMVFVSFTRPEGVLLTENALKAVLPLFPDKKSGLDYVHLGYTAGLETAIRAFAQDIHVFKNDYYGTPVGQLPLLNKLSSGKDFNIWVIYITSDIEAYVRQVSPIAKLLVVSISGYSPVVRPYIRTGQVLAMLDSIRGCAEFELLSGFKGLGVSAMDIMSTAQFYMIALIVLGNILWYYGKRKNNVKK